MSLGVCDACGAPLAAVGGKIACGSCLKPAVNHPLMRSISSNRLAQAEAKLAEVAIQQLRLNEQRELWERIRDEEKAALGDGPRPQPTRAPQFPSMMRDGMKIVPPEEISKVTAAEAFQAMGRKLPEPAESFCDHGPAEPLMAKATNDAGAAVLAAVKKKR